MRPNTLSDFVGQESLIGKSSVLRKMVERDALCSFILWGPPGSGKTTLARVISKMTHSRFVQLSAVTAGVQQIREITQEAIKQKQMNRRTVFFLDEIHRFNKAQQDTLLPHVESGVLTLIGATTENPSFEVNSALLSRCRVFVLEKLNTEQIEHILRTAVERELNGFDPNVRVEIDNDTIRLIAQIADGDARIALNTLEMAWKGTTPEIIAPPTAPPPIAQPSTELSPALTSLPTPDNVFITIEDDDDDEHPPVSTTTAPEKNTPVPTQPTQIYRISSDTVQQILQRTHFLYDKHGEQHFDAISALHKSMRGSDVDASLYWLMRMLEGGESPIYIARRLIRFSSEDVGLADPLALPQAVATFQACDLLGVPECNVVLAQCVAYLARAPKSNSLYEAMKAVQQVIKEQPNAPVPLHLRNAPTKLMEALGYSKGYQYNPDHEEPVQQQYLPEAIRGSKFFSFKLRKDAMSRQTTEN